jgi:hypothetical protein
MSPSEIDRWNHNCALDALADIQDHVDLHIMAQYDRNGGALPCTCRLTEPPSTPP